MVESINEQTSGVFIIAATPFTEDGSVDTASAESLVEFYIDKGVSGMTVLGMMGEAPKLAADEADTWTSRKTSPLSPVSDSLREMAMGERNEGSTWVFRS